MNFRQLKLNLRRLKDQGIGVPRSVVMKAFANLAKRRKIAKRG